MNEIEVQIIGMLIINPSLMNLCILRKEHFSHPDIADIFFAQQDEYKKHGTITIQRLLQVRNINQDLVLSCSDTVVSARIDLFTQIQMLCIEQYQVREISNQSDALVNGDITLEEFNSFLKKINALGFHKSVKITPNVLMDSIMKEKTKEIKFQKFKKLEKKLYLGEGEFCIIAGGTGVGKSALALNLANDLSQNYLVKYYNLEMVDEDVYHRLLSINTKIPIKELREHTSFNDIKMNNLSNGANSFQQKDIELISGRMTISKLRSEIMAYSGKKHLIVFVDHIGLLGSDERNPYNRMTEIAKELRRISLEAKCTIFGLCQLNRDATKGKDKPELSMLRDSGELEQSASKVMFIWKFGEGENESYSVIIEKNRSGPKGIVNVDYQKSTQAIIESFM